MTSRPVAPALLAPLLGFAVCALPSLGPAVRAAAQEVEWKRELRGDIRNVLNVHYTRAPSSEIRSSNCLAERGDICFGGDHEDWICRSVVPCRTPRMMQQFTSELERAVSRRPDDPYTVAQAAYALSRLGQADRAIELAGQCGAAQWWCDLVVGMAQHRAGLSADAERRFRAALLHADPELACRLSGIGELLKERDAEVYMRLPCPGPERLEFEERFWWLSDPLLTMPGNDRWTEHITRRFELLLHERLRRAVEGRPVNRSQFGRHMEAVTRRGHPDSWDSRTRWKSGAGASYRFTPASLVQDGARALRYEIEAGRWDEGYTPVAYGPVVEVPGQVARFLEGDSLLLAVSADLDGAPFVAVETRFVAAAGPSGPFVGRVLRNAGLRPAISVGFAAVPLVVAIEAFSERGDAARMRQGVTPLPGDGLVVSDPLLVDPRIPDLPATRQEAVDRMLPRPRIGRESEMAAYWEVYGLEAGETMEISVSIEREGVGVLTRVLRSLSGRQAAPAPVVSWTEPASGPVHEMALALSVAELTDGNYDLRIAVARPDGAVATAIRRFSVGGR